MKKPPRTISDELFEEALELVVSKFGQDDLHPKFDRTMRDRLDAIDEVMESKRKRLWPWKPFAVMVPAMAALALLYLAKKPSSTPAVEPMAVAQVLEMAEGLPIYENYDLVEDFDVLVDLEVIQSLESGEAG